MKKKRSPFTYALGMAAGLAAGWAVAQQVWVYRQIRRDVYETLATQKNELKTGLTFERTEEAKKYTIRHTVEDGIERIVYTPKERRFKTPIVMQHGMWHGAWCWHLWQELLAEQGWETHAHSLPGHAGSPTQRPIPLCTLDYYLSFLKTEVQRHEQTPVLMGHSMGGALTQWYLKYVGDNLPAAVLAAPWVSHSTMADGGVHIVKRDPLVVPLTSLAWSAWPWVRNPRRAAENLISPRAVYTPEELHAKLGNESVIVTYQHNPPFWYPPENVQTPMLLLAGEEDAVVTLEGLRRSAAHYGADFVVAQEAGHNLMMEHNYRELAQEIHAWLVGQGVG
ncbi:MAG: alpha/beta hydrolase [Chloroflexi bacterium]|nr:alpha/beta hydrolase [Chloroflexota bacterium]